MQNNVCQNVDSALCFSILFSSLRNAQNCFGNKFKINILPATHISWLIYIWEWRHLPPKLGEMRWRVYCTWLRTYFYNVTPTHYHMIFTQAQHTELRPHILISALESSDSTDQACRTLFESIKFIVTVCHILTW